MSANFNQDSLVSAQGLVMNSIYVAGGRIGLVRCPGATGQLEADFQWLLSCGANLMLTLITRAELEAMRLTTFFELADELGLAYRHLPINDMRTPEPNLRDQWDEIVRDLLNRLARGELVVIHCRAGLGRAGTIAAALLVHAGFSPSDAITEVRRSRPGALETSDQERWVFAQNRQTFGD